MVCEDSIIHRKEPPMKTALALYAFMFALIFPIVYAVWSL